MKYLAIRLHFIQFFLNNENYWIFLMGSHRIERKKIYIDILILSRSVHIKINNSFFMSIFFMHYTHAHIYFLTCISFRQLVFINGFSKYISLKHVSTFFC
jgi:hypothetical protein